MAVTVTLANAAPPGNLGAAQGSSLTLSGAGVANTVEALTGAAVGGATPGAGGIAFPAAAVAVADANTLDDYEEGTFVPAFTNLTETGGAATIAGSYVKIGKQVHWQVIVTPVTNTSATGNTTFFSTNALPVPASATPMLMSNMNTLATGIGFLSFSGATAIGWVPTWTNQTGPILLTGSYTV